MGGSWREGGESGIGTYQYNDLTNQKSMLNPIARQEVKILAGIELGGDWNWFFKFVSEVYYLTTS